MKLENKVAIVTGGAQGIGRALTLGLARAGANVVIADIQKDVAEATAEDVRITGRKAFAIQADVSKISDIGAMVERTTEMFGTVDILVNNAGISGRTPFFDTSEKMWQQIQDVNLKSAFFCSQFAAKVMAQKRYGKIVSVSSTSGFVAGPAQIPYAVAKAGVRMMTSALAVELAPFNINVNAVAPGLICTPMTERAFGSTEALLKRAKDKTPLVRPGMPQDLVGGVIYLCSSDSDFVTGHTLVIDGGWLAQ
jgi:NAD(P)-dependent dehydrogenase (short-subunit alcohol dehydrogenase family)